MVSLDDGCCRCRPLERLQYEWQRSRTWANLGSRSGRCKIHCEWILLSPSIILALVSLISVSSWGITGRRNRNRSNRFNLAKIAVIALSVAGVVVAFVSSSLLLTTAVLIVSIFSNVGLAIWDFVNQIHPDSAEEDLSR